MQTELQKRREQLDEIIRICGIESDEHRVLRSQLESFSGLAVEVTHTLMLRAHNALALELAAYWRERAESAEVWIAGENRQTN